MNLEHRFGVRPDGLTILPFEKGKHLTWDVSIPHPLCTSHSSKNKEVGQISSIVEEKKSRKYQCLTEDYLFTPIVIDTLGAYGKLSRTVLHKI